VEEPETGFPFFPLCPHSFSLSSSCSPFFFLVSSFFLFPLSFPLFFFLHFCLGLPGNDDGGRIGEKECAWIFLSSPAGGKKKAVPVHINAGVAGLKWCAHQCSGQAQREQGPGPHQRGYSTFSIPFQSTCAFSPCGFGRGAMANKTFSNPKKKQKQTQALSCPRFNGRQCQAGMVGNVGLTQNNVANEAASLPFNPDAGLEIWSALWKAAKPVPVPGVSKICLRGCGVLAGLVCLLTTFCTLTTQPFPVFRAGDHQNRGAVWRGQAEVAAGRSSSQFFTLFLFPPLPPANFNLRILWGMQPGFGEKRMFAKPTWGR